MLDSVVANAGMDALLNHVISVDEVQQFKTHPASYGLVGEHFALPPKEILFVSSNAWDALGATWFAFITLWVNRQALPNEAIGTPPHHVGSDLTHVLRVLQLQP